MNHGFGDHVVAALERLGGRFPAEFPIREEVMPTPAGPRRLPPWVQALTAIGWRDGTLRTDDEFEWGVGLFHAREVEPGMVGEDRAWVCVGSDDGQFYYLVDLDESHHHDPSVYRVDHEGDQEAGAGDRPFGVSRRAEARPAARAG